MKKTITKTFVLVYVIAAALLFHTKLFAENFPADKTPVPVHPSVSRGSNSSSAKIIQPKNEVQNIFDIQFNIPLGNPSSVSCVYTGTEFWLGLFGNDSLYTLDPSGNITSGFKVPGVGLSNSGVRGLTYDGTYIYAVCNDSAILRIDPVSKTLVDSIVIPFAARGLAYDSTANGGQGGFWTCNYNSSFRLVSMTGAILQTITLAEHNVSNAYGIAFDPYTSGGPYLWAFAQGTSGDSSKLHRVSIPTHLHTGVVHNVNADIVMGNAIAGGVSITWRYDPSHYTIMGITQGAPDRLFGYELGDYFPPAVDAALTKIEFYPAFAQIPTFEVSPMNWDVTIDNLGTSTLNDVTTSLVVDDGVNAVFSPPDFHNIGVSAGSNAVANFASYIPPQVLQVYNVTSSTNTGAQVDQDGTNDDQSYSFEITDSTMARDNGIPTNRLGLPGNTGGVLGQIFELQAGADVSSATFLLASPDIGDSVSVDLYSYSNEPDVIIASTDVYVITGADTDGVELTLPFTNGPLFVNPGLYFLGVNQYVTDSNITLRTTAFNFRPGSAFFQFTGGSWIAVEDNNGGQNPFYICYLLRLNMHNFTINTSEIENKNLKVYPVPATGQLNINFKSGDGFKATLFDMVGNKIVEQDAFKTDEMTLDVSGVAPGMYVLRTTSNGSSTSLRVAIN